MANSVIHSAEDSTPTEAAPNEADTSAISTPAQRGPGDSEDSPTVGFVEPPASTHTPLIRGLVRDGTPLNQLPNRRFDDVQHQDQEPKLPQPITPFLSSFYPCPGPGCRNLPRPCHHCGAPHDQLTWIDQYGKRTRHQHCSKCRVERARCWHCGAEPPKLGYGYYT